MRIVTVILLFAVINLLRWIWIKDAPKSGGGSGCLGILVAVGLSVAAEGIAQKDLDGDGKIAYTWTDEVLNSQGLKPEIPYFGEVKYRTTASKSYYERIPWSIRLNEDNTFTSYHWERYATPNWVQVDGNWDYCLGSEGMVYRVLDFDDYYGRSFPSLYVDKDFKAFIIDEDKYYNNTDDAATLVYVGDFYTQQPRGYYNPW